MLEETLAMNVDLDCTFAVEVEPEVAQPQKKPPGGKPPNACHRRTTWKDSQTPVDIFTYCEECEGDLDDPCFEHTDVKRIIFDKLPTPLAYSSLPDALKIFQFDNVFDLNKGEAIFTKQEIEASTLFGPLVAPLVPPEDIPPDALRYVLWSEDTQELQAYDLSDDFLCNWIKFIRPVSTMKEANVVAYQQNGFIYLVAIRDILPSTELRVFVKRPRSYTIRECYDLPAVAHSADFTFPTFVKVACREYQENSTPVRKSRRPRKKLDRLLASTHQKEPAVTVESITADQLPEPSLIVTATVAADEPVVPPVDKPVRLETVPTEETRRAARRRRKNAGRGKDPVRLKLVEGFTLTPEEQLKREKELVRKRAYRAEWRRKDRIARGKDPEPQKWTVRGNRYQSAPLFDWQIAERQAAGIFEELETEGPPPGWVPPEPKEKYASNSTYKMLRKLKEGIPLTPREQLSREKVLARGREASRKRHMRARMAKGLDPKSERTNNFGGKPYRKPPFAWQLKEQGTTVDEDQSRSSAEDSNGESSQEELTGYPAAESVNSV